MSEVRDMATVDINDEDFKKFMDEEVEFLKSVKYIKEPFYNPEIWRTNFLGVPYCRNVVEFDIDEQRMIREMVAITGKDRSAIIREGVRYLYDEVILWHKKQTEHCKFVKTDWFEDGKR